MKKHFIAIVLLLSVFASASYASLIEVDVNNNINIDIINEEIDSSSNLVRFYTEFYNTGSVPYSARVRFYVYDGEVLAFDGWSQEKIMMPGDKKTFEASWYASVPGNYSTKMRVYFGNEVAESISQTFSVNSVANPQDFFEVANFRTYDNYVIFDLKSSKDIQNVVVIPSDYVSGWIFEQSTIDFVKGNMYKVVKMNYYPTAWMPSNLKLSIVADGGRYYSEKTLEMKKEEGFSNILYRLFDSFRLLLA